MNVSIRRRALAFAFALFPVLPFAPQSALAQSEPKSVSPYVPSPQSVVADMLKLANVSARDYVIDLGSGDGRIVLTAAKVFGASGFGVEIIDRLVTLSNETAKNEGVADRVRFLKQDLFQTDISKASVLTMYLLPDIVNQLREKLLKELRPGSRILSHDYPLAGWIPENRVEMDLQEKVQISGVTTTIIYLYVVPASVGGRWAASFPAPFGSANVPLELRQQITRMAGDARIAGREASVEDGKILGETISFRLMHGGRSYAFSGTVRDSQITGTVEGGGTRASWSAVRSR